MTEMRLPCGPVARPFQTAASMRHGALDLGPAIHLAKGRVHEVLGDAADMFAILAASQMKGPVFWIGSKREIDTLSPIALQDFLDPTRLILIAGVSRTEILWATEQALRACGSACVLAAPGRGPDLRESRRLQIAAEESGAIGVMPVQGKAVTSAAETRWLCEAAGDRAWNWTCTKNRRGNGGAWRVTWEEDGHAPGAIHLAAATAV